MKLNFLRASKLSFFIVWEKTLHVSAMYQSKKNANNFLKGMLATYQTLQKCKESWYLIVLRQNNESEEYLASIHGKIQQTL